MRILQIIDSLETGGAERMAVNYANALGGKIEFSGLVATRAEGGLKQQIDPQVNYLYLKKRHTLDIGAAMRLWRYCRRNKIDIIHAHSTSYFISIIAKLRIPGLKLIWHDHNGMSENLSNREYFPLNICSLLFSGIIVVNHQLHVWAERELHCPNILYLSNFTYLMQNPPRITTLFGTPGKRILMLANLREQKDHFMLLDVASLMKDTHPDWTFHLVGKDFEDEYSAKVRRTVSDAGLDDTVFIYGSCIDTDAIIEQCDIAVLTSNSEGLPVALLEYGLHKKPVVVTAVGQIPGIVTNGENGFITASRDIEGFYRWLVRLTDDGDLRIRLGEQLHNTTNRSSSAQEAIATYLEWINKL
jgi:glycosyltransferase involved in cell wall biosynthesis